MIGLRGELGKNWNYDGYLQYGSVQFAQEQTGNLNTSRIQQALFHDVQATLPQMEPETQAPDRNLALELVRVTEAAALAAGR